MSDPLGIFAACLGIFSSTLGLISMAANQFSKLGLIDPNRNTFLRIYVGLDSPDGLDDTGGELPDTVLYNIYSEKIGHAYDPGS